MTQNDDKKTIKANLQSQCPLNHLHLVQAEELPSIIKEVRGLTYIRFILEH